MKGEKISTSSTFLIPYLTKVCLCANQIQKLECDGHQPNSKTMSYQFHLTSAISLPQKKKTISSRRYKPNGKLLQKEYHCIVYIVKNIFMENIIILSPFKKNKVISFLLFHVLCIYLNL